MGVKPSVKSVKLVPTLCLLALVSLCIQSFLFLQSAASQPSQVRVPRQGTVKQHASAGHAHSHSRTLSPIPQTIHQIYKTTHASGWGSRAQFIQSWIERNPSFRHAVVDDEAALKFLDKHFSTEEKVLDAYRRFPLTVLRTDLLRYLLVYIHGGLYADADTICEQPIGDAFTNWTRNHTNVSFIGALEWFRDPMHKEQHTTQIAQWAFAAAPRHPALRTLIDEIVERTLAAPLEFLANQSHVLELTGPTPFSRHLTDYLLRNGDILDQTIALATTSTVRKNVELSGPWIFPRSGFLLLPVNSFMADAEWRHGQSLSHPYALVSHKFAGTWTDGWRNSPEGQLSFQKLN